MDCVVNDKYRYIMFYGAKAGCTSLRNLFLAIHRDEMSQEQLGALRSYHNLNEVCPYDPERDYGDYYKFYIARNPYSRVVSAYLDQYCFVKHSGVRRMFEAWPPQDGEPDNFLELLRYLKSVPDFQRDSHFQTQSHFGHAERMRVGKPWFRRLQPGEVALDYVGDIGRFNFHMEKVFNKVFKNHPEVRARAIAEIGKLHRMNSSFYGEEELADAASLSSGRLKQMLFAPKPQDFFTSAEARELVQEIYATDFDLFKYDRADIPQKKASPEATELPADFDWQVYKLLNPDLEPAGYTDQRTVTYHYLQHGRHEAKKRFYSLTAPQGFNWQRYVELHADLQAAGIDNERDALIHYLTFGYHEQRAV